MVCGQARSHCVNYTFRDILKYLPAEKLILLEDGCSDVYGYQEEGCKFVREMREAGVTISNCGKLAKALALKNLEESRRLAMTDLDLKTELIGMQDVQRQIQKQLLFLSKQVQDHVVTPSRRGLRSLSSPQSFD